jgi:uncharacterized protein YdaU (DUF1376 family)
MTDKTYEPKYICWYENDFVADVVVRRMTPHQRLMYRSLLQGAFYCSTRPYLPADDQDLADLADADSLEMWLANKSAVMRKFTLEGGRWSHKRLLADWEKQVSAHAQASSAGQASGRARNKGAADTNDRSTSVKQPFNDRSTNETETETEMKPKQKEKPNETIPETETETGNDSASVSASASVSGMGSFDQSEDKRQQPRHGEIPDPSVDDDDLDWILMGLVSVWKTVTDKPGSEVDFRHILRDHWTSLPENPERYIAGIIRWTFGVSNYWSDKVIGSGGFAKAFKEIRKQYDIYMAKVAEDGEDSDEELSGRPTISRDDEDVEEF